MQWDPCYPSAASDLVAAFDIPVYFITVTMVQGGLWPDMRDNHNTKGPGKEFSPDQSDGCAGFWLDFSWDQISVMVY